MTILLYHCMVNDLMSRRHHACVILVLTAQVRFFLAVWSHAGHLFQNYVFIWKVSDRDDQNDSRELNIFILGQHVNCQRVNLAGNVEGPQVLALRSCFLVFYRTWQLQQWNGIRVRREIFYLVKLVSPTLLDGFCRHANGHHYIHWSKTSAIFGRCLLLRNMPNQSVDISFLTYQALFTTIIDRKKGYYCLVAYNYITIAVTCIYYYRTAYNNDKPSLDIEFCFCSCS